MTAGTRTYFASLPNIRFVAAFEPDAQLAAQAMENVKLNGEAFAKKVQLFNKFVGNKDDASWCSIDKVAPDIARPIVVKLDVDGGEMDVLQGAEQTLRRGGVNMVIETHTPELEHDCKAFLEAMGYQTRIINQGWYRSFIRDGRQIAHNRWMVAIKA